jgi:sulfite reductase (NADPH) flavoprotein alpha-component
MRRVTGMIKQALLQVHSIVGLTLSLLLTLIALTGALMSFEDEIGASLDAGMMRTAPRSAPALTPDQLIARLQASGDPGKIAAITLASDPSAAAHIRFARNEDRSRPSALYVDPYDAHVLGMPRAEDFFATVRKLHRWLLLSGDNKGYGRPITGVAALGLIVMLISGLVLRWPPRARSVKSGLKIWLKPNLALRGRGLNRSLHAVVGTWLLLVYPVMALTGLWYAFDWYRDGATWLLSHPSTIAKPMPPISPRGAAAADARPLADKPVAEQPVGVDRAWTTFLHEQGGRFATAQLTLPAGPGTVVRIRSWPRGATRDGARDEFRIDATSGQLLSSEIYADKPFGERVLASILDIHRGSILGWPGKLLFMLAAASMPLFAVTGLLLYVSRRKLRPAPRPTLGSLVPGE